jgi:hypothetical protein
MSGHVNGLERHIRWLMAELRFLQDFKANTTQQGSIDGSGGRCKM